MNNNTLLIALLALTVGGIAGYFTAHSTNTLPMMTNQKNGSVPHGMHRMPNGSFMHNDGRIGMMGGMEHGMMMVSSEREFITEMIPHHQEAIDTAREVLARGATTPEVKALVEDIITAQEREVTDMKSWYEAWYGTPYLSSVNYQPMMRDLTNLSGVELDKVFLEDMIMHHMGAIMMAHSVQGYIEHDEVQDLAETIIETQTEEIQLMRRLRTDL